MEKKKREQQKTLRGYGPDSAHPDSFDDATAPSAPHPEVVAEQDGADRISRKRASKAPAEALPAGEAQVFPPGGVGATPPAPEQPEDNRRRGTPMVEIEVIHEHGPAPRTDRSWRAVEIWTRNRIYTLDPQMCCVEVTDRVTRKSETGHPFLGARMVGGQHRDGEAIELSYPYPRPGSEAVFEQVGTNRRGGFSRTSAVTRVVIRLRLVTVAPSHVVPTWEEITNAFSLPGAAGSKPKS